MKTVGEILKQARLNQKISIEEVEKVTRIKKKFISALEENNFQELPSFTFTRGFLKNYSEFLNLPSNDLTALYRRQVKEDSLDLLPKSIINNDDWPIKIDPQTAVIFSLAIFLGIFLFYLLSQYFSFAGKPFLSISYPKNNLQVDTEVIEIKGKTDSLGVLTINEQPVEVQSNGLFSEKIELNEGENRIIIAVENKSGKENKKELRVTYHQ